MEREKEDEVYKAQTMQHKFEAKIVELEERIKVLMADSGDQVASLERKIKEMVQQYETEKENAQRTYLQSKNQMLEEHENLLQQTKNDYEIQIRQIVQQKDNEREDLRQEMQSKIDAL